MPLKDDLQNIIALKQSSIPASNIKPRESLVPMDRTRIVTTLGVRRCGKSSLMSLGINRLLEAGVPRENILWVGFDDERLSAMKREDLDTILGAYCEMYPDIPIKDVYMFFDEIQDIDGWELFAIRLLKSYTSHIFLSGSNSKALSEDIATQLRGWSDEIRVYPLSFSEFCSFKGVGTRAYATKDVSSLKAAFRQYNAGGGFPEVVLEADRYRRVELLQGYFDVMLLKDMVERYGLPNPEIVRYFLKRMLLSLSKPFSVNAVYGDIRSQGRKVTKDFLYELTSHACSVFMFSKVPRFSGSIIKVNDYLPKYYPVDNGLRNAVVSPLGPDSGPLLENTVYWHLCRKKLPSQKITYYSDGSECDFLVQDENGVSSLVQSCWSIDEKETRSREIKGLVAASRATGCKDMTIVTFEQSDIIESAQGVIKVVPAWKWML